MAHLYKIICNVFKEKSDSADDWLRPKISRNVEIGKSEKLYIEKLVLNPIKLRVSISNSFGPENEDCVDSFDVGILSFTSVDASSISLDGYLMANIYESNNVLISRLLKHYRSEAVSELYKMLGSFEILGNPAKFIDSLGVGMK